MNNKFALIPAGLVLASAAASAESAHAIAAPTTRSFNWEKYVGHNHHKRHHAKRHHHVKRHHVKRHYHENKWEKRGRETGRYYEMKYGR